MSIHTLEKHRVGGSGGAFLRPKADSFALPEPPFPQELFDEILAQLHDDKATLKTCCLVCHSWLPTASSHLFRRLQWSPRTHNWPAHLFNPNVEPPRLLYNKVYAERMAYCLDSLTRSSRIRHAARELVLSSIYPGWAFSRPETHDLETVVAVVDLLPRLHTVELVDCNICALPSSVPSSTARRLKTLRIRHPNGNFVTCLLPVTLRLLAQFSQMTEVIIQGEISAPPHATTVPSSIPRTRVGALSLIPPRQGGYAQLHRALDGLASRIDIDALQSFTCRYNWTSGATSFVERAPALTALTYAPFTVSLRLHPSARLRTLTALITLASLRPAHELVVPATRDTPPRTWDRLLKDLGMLCLEDLEELGIMLSGRRERRARPRDAPPLADDVVRQEYVEDLGALLAEADWATLGAVTERGPKFKRLRVQVAMRLPGGDHRLLDRTCLRAVENLIEESMRARAVLDVVVRVEKA